MNTNKIAIIATLSVSLLALSSCGKKTSDRSDSLTGWTDNDETGWYFSGDQDPGQGGPGMVFVEGGTFTKGQTKDNVMHDWNNTPSRQQVRSFYISETEVTNRDYKMYLSWLRLFFDPKIEEYRGIYVGSLPDTMVWRNKLASQELFVENYFRDPAFDYYPVVGINWLQANNYTEWLTDRVNERKLMEEGIIDKEMYVFEWSDSAEFSNSKPAFFHKRYKEMGTNMFGEESNIFTENKEANEASSSSGKKGFLGMGKNRNKSAGSYKNYNQKWKALAKSNSKAIASYRLPTESEWEYAALALMENREYNKYKGKIIPEKELRRKKGKNRGNFMTNIKRGRGDYSGIGGWQNDGYAITAPVKRFKPNDLGIYGMFGNVSEWTADVYRPIIDDEASDFNYHRGNTFKKTIRQDGMVDIVGLDIKYDTLDDGRMVYRALPGQVREEVYEDAKNYRDGDHQSLLDPYKNIDEEGNPIAKETDSEFNNPKREFIVTEDGKVVLKKDTSDVTTDMSNKNRVIKGGSWNDRAYWMDPAQRRYMLETESASWLGFRVAHDRTGADASGGRATRGSR
ncbi:MAG: gliding motility lipoprotein GldJ [Flavobacteriales bacterium]